MGNCVVNDPEEEQLLKTDYENDNKPGGQGVIQKNLILSVKWNKWFECYYHNVTHVMKCLNRPVQYIRRVSHLDTETTT